MQLTGMHHISALTADIQANVRFYTQVLGMRLVKKTVNQDDTSSYHMFYGDERGNPGTEVTFFDLPYSRQITYGTNSIANVALRVPGETALAFWEDRLRSHGITPGAVREAGGRKELPFQDAEGQRLSLVADDGEGVPGGVPWVHSPVPQDMGIVGLGPVTLDVRHLEPTAAVLTDVLGFRHAGTYDGPHGEMHVFATGAGGTGGEVHVVQHPDMPLERLGHGGVHHVAFRIPDDPGLYEAWLDRVEAAGFRTSGLVDRFYFRSIYFREPNGILFELATDGPGFVTDETFDTLGERLALPPFLEPQRAAIEKGLKPVDTGDRVSQ